MRLIYQEKGTITINPDGSEVETESYTIGKPLIHMPPRRRSYTALLGADNVQSDGTIETDETITVDDERHPNAPAKTIKQDRKLPSDEAALATQGMETDDIHPGISIEHVPAEHADPKDKMGIHTSSIAPCVGCAITARVTDPGVVGAASAAVELMNKEKEEDLKSGGKKTPGYVMLGRVISAQSQVVAGIRYFLTVEIQSCPCDFISFCNGDHRHRNDAAVQDSKCAASHAIPGVVHHLTVWDQPWREPRYVLEKSRKRGH